MERGVEDGHLRHARQRLGGRGHAGERGAIVERSHPDELLEAVSNGGVDDEGISETGPAVDDAVGDRVDGAGLDVVQTLDGA